MTDSGGVTRSTVLDLFGRPSEQRTTGADGALLERATITRGPARSWVQAAYARALSSEDSCVAEDLATKLTAGGYRILDLIADLTLAESFRHRAVVAEVEQ
jgi:hypothetical protein